MAHRHNLFPFVYPAWVTQSSIRSETNHARRICQVVSLNIFCVVKITLKFCLLGSCHQSDLKLDDFGDDLSPMIVFHSGCPTDRTNLHPPTQAIRCVNKLRKGKHPVPLYIYYSCPERNCAPWQYLFKKWIPLSTWCVCMTSAGWARNDLQRDHVICMLADPALIGETGIWIALLIVFS